MRSKRLIPVITALLLLGGGPLLRAADLQSVIAWARENGSAQKIDRRLAKALGLGDADVLVSQKAFRLNRQHTVFAVSNPTNRNEAVNVFMLSDNSTNGVVWLADPDGNLKLTAAYSTNDTIVRVPNADHGVEFEQIKTFFLEKAANYDAFKASHGAPPPRRRTNSPAIKPEQK